jgi:RNA polymerase sigma factor (sigma-70 family)
VTERQIDGCELWSGVRAGDAAAFETLYAELSDPVFGFCLRRTGEWETAQDCTSLVFLEAWRLRATLRAESAGLAWMFGIAHNVVRNTTRTKRRHRNLLQRLPLGVLTDDFEVDVAARIDAKAEVARVLVAVDRLPENERDVIALSLSSELTYEQISIALNIPVGTVKSRLSRARTRLRNALQAELPAPATLPPGTPATARKPSTNLGPGEAP